MSFLFSNITVSFLCRHRCLLFCSIKGITLACKSFKWNYFSLSNGTQEFVFNVRSKIHNILHIQLVQVVKWFLGNWQNCGFYAFFNKNDGITVFQLRLTGVTCEAAAIGKIQTNKQCVVHNYLLIAKLADPTGTLISALLKAGVLEKVNQSDTSRQCMHQLHEQNIYVFCYRCLLREIKT